MVHDSFRKPVSTFPDHAQIMTRSDSERPLIQKLLWFVALWLFGVGFWAAVSHLCMTVAMKYAPASTLAPLHYLELPMAVFLGYAIWGTFPKALTWCGIALIVGSGLYIIAHEHRSSQVHPMPPPMPVRNHLHASASAYPRRPAHPRLPLQRGFPRVGECVEYDFYLAAVLVVY